MKGIFGRRIKLGLLSFIGYIMNQIWPIFLIGKDLYMAEISLERYNITRPTILRNASPSVLYEEALANETGSAITSTGALAKRQDAALTRG